MLDELHLCEAVDHDQPTCPTSESGRTVQVRTLIFCCAISEVGSLRVQHMHGLWDGLLAGGCGGVPARDIEVLVQCLDVQRGPLGQLYGMAHERSHAQEGRLRVTVLHPRPLHKGVNEVARDVLPTHTLCPGRTARASVPTPIYRASKAGLTIAVHCGLEPTAVAAVADSADHQQTR